MFKFKARLPEEYGEYLFVLKNDETVYGRYDSYPFPYASCIKVVLDYELETFYYIEEKAIKGYFSYGWS